MFNVMAQLFDYNATELIMNPMRIAIEPFIAIFGNLFWGLFFGFVLAGVYVNDNTSYRLFIMLIIIGTFFSLILPYGLVALLGIITAFAGATILYKVYVGYSG